MLSFLSSDLGLIVPWFFIEPGNPQRNSLSYSELSFISEEEETQVMGGTQDEWSFYSHKYRVD